VFPETFDSGAYEGTEYDAVFKKNEYLAMLVVMISVIIPMKICRDRVDSRNFMLCCHFV
jgi:hypothetical protein